jgi:NAD(P)H dehydrogenase (quinone)
MKKVYIIFYSRYGNTLKLAQAVEEGAKSVEGVEVVMRRVEELVPDFVIEKDERWAEMKKHIEANFEPAKTEDLLDADAVIFGSPTRFGNMSSQLKYFIDKTAGVWLQGGLAGKVGAAFTSTSSMHGGQESTLLSMYLPMLHHGMLICGIPYTHPELSTTRDGCSPYGASAVTGVMADQPPTETDLKLSAELGRRVAEFTLKIRT